MKNISDKIELDSSLFGVDLKSQLVIPNGYFEVSSFGQSLRDWTQLPQEKFLPVLHLLEGNSLVCHGNRVEAKVYDGSFDGANKSDEELVKLWFTENPKFGVAMKPRCLGISAKVVPGSVRLVKKSKGSNKKYGPYRKLTVEFDTVFRCWDPVKDLSEAELAKPFIMKPFCLSIRKDKNWLRALKAVLMRPGQVYIGDEDRFIMRMPQNIEDAACILDCNLDGIYYTGFSFFTELGGLFAPGAEQRTILRDGYCRFRFLEFEGKSLCDVDLGNLAHGGYWHLSVRIPFVNTHPKLFVKNMRRGLAACTEFVERCALQGKLENVSLKFGCFEFYLRIRETPCAESYTFQSFPKVVFNELEPQWCEAKMVGAVSCYVSLLRKYLTALADFVEMLSKDSDDIAVTRRNLNALIINSIRLDPLNHVEDSRRAIREFASYCISGEWASVQNSMELPF